MQYHSRSRATLSQWSDGTQSTVFRKNAFSIINEIYEIQKQIFTHAISKSARTMSSIVLTCTNRTKEMAYVQLMSVVLITPSQSYSYNTRPAHVSSYEQLNTPCSTCIRHARIIISPTCIPAALQMRTSTKTWSHQHSWKFGNQCIKLNS